MYLCQLVWKVLFGILNSSKKTNEKIRLNYYDTLIWIVFVPFLEEFNTPKRHFEINWPLAKKNMCVLTMGVWTRDTILNLKRAHIFCACTHAGAGKCVHASAGVGTSASAGSGAAEKPCTLKVCLRGS